MGTIILAKQNLTSALIRLHETLQHCEDLQLMQNRQASLLMSNEELERTLRDSLIQRFEFCSDLFWKYLKRYEEETFNISLEIVAPRSVIMAACKAAIISEPDAEILLEMIKSRNFTSHIYKEETANEISAQIPQYYKIMQKYAEKL
jgi:nucleotidyltransferase substrate binding protein (TIGR01987 family)